MCGIIVVKKNKKGKKNKGRASKAVLKRFNNQRSRGTRGFGYIAIENGKVLGVVRAETENEIEVKLKRETANHIIFHHRTPTSTPNLEDMAHPITVKNALLTKNYYVVHNGMISNPDELKADHELLGFEYTTDMSIVNTKVTKTRSGEKKDVVVEKDCFNDSEAFAIDLALYLEGVNNTINSKGSIAFVCLETDKEDNVLNIHYGRNEGNPLVVENNHGILAIKSEGEGEEVKADILHTINYETNELTENDVEIGQTWRRSAGYANDGDTKNIYGSRGYDFDNANEEDEDKKTEIHTDLLPSPNEFWKDVQPYRTEWIDGKKYMYNEGGSLIGTCDQADETNFESMGDQVIEKACLDSNCTMENLQALIEEENDLVSHIEETEEKLTEHENGVNILKSEDLLYEKTWKDECVADLINIRQEINVMEFDLQDTD